MGYGASAVGVGVTGLLGGFMVPMESYLAPRVFGQRAVGRAMGLLSGDAATPPLFGPYQVCAGEFGAEGGRSEDDETVLAAMRKSGARDATS
jgi:hypothetical protein